MKQDQSRREVLLRTGSLPIVAWLSGCQEVARDQIENIPTGDFLGEDSSQTVTSSPSSESQPETQSATIRDRSNLSMAELASEYSKFIDTNLNVSFYESRSEELADDALPDATDLSIESIRSVAEGLLPNALGPAWTGLAIVDIVDQMTTFVASIHCNNIADALVYPNNYHEVTSRLGELQGNAIEIIDSDDSGSLRSLYQTRRELIEDLNDVLINYIENLRGRPHPGVFDENGFSAYQTIRLQVDLLRLYLIADYTATWSWLQDREQLAYPGQNTGRRMPNHRSDHALFWSSIFSTIESSNDYVVYRLNIPEDYRTEDAELVVRIQSPNVRGFESVISGRNTNKELAWRDPFRSVSVTDPNAEYLVAVRADDRIGPFQIQAGVHTTIYDLPSFDHVKVPIEVAEVGFPENYEPLDQREADPVITQFQTEKEGPGSDGGVSVRVEVENRGETADWQSIAIGLPNITDSSLVQVVDSDLDSVHILEPGTEVGADYGTSSTDLEYVLVEGAVEEWAADASHALSVSVSSETREEIDLYVKSVAVADGIWTAAPSPGETDVSDQQNEFVITETLGLQSRVVDGFESGGYGDGTPVTWQTESPGERIAVQSDVVKNGDSALEMKSGEVNDNHAILYHQADSRQIEDGEIYRVWLRTDGRVFYRLGSQSPGDGSHQIRAGVVTDHDKLQIRTRDGNGEQIQKHKFGSAASNTWYLFEMEMYPSRSELIGRVKDSSESLIGEATVNFSGEPDLPITTLHVPTPFGRQDRGWFDDVTIESVSPVDDSESDSSTDSNLVSEGFEDGNIDGWNLIGGDHGELTATESNDMVGSWVATLAADGSGGKNRLAAYREFDGTLAAGMTLEGWVSFSHEDSHIPKIRYEDSSNQQNHFHLRFDPPIDNVWFHVSHGENRNRENFASVGAINTVYRAKFDLAENSIACELSSKDGQEIASTTLDHPEGFSYSAIDRVLIESQDETPIDVGFDEITYPT